MLGSSIAAQEQAIAAMSAPILFMWRTEVSTCMPELPEVETIVRALRPRLLGRRFQAVDIFHTRIVRYSSLDLPQTLQGQRVEEVTRHGKFILQRVGSHWLTIHLGMTGQLLFDADPTQYTRAQFQLDDGVLLYDDIRMFGSLEIDRTRPDMLGPDALSEHEWHPRLLRRKAPIKALLLNQSIVAGIGNIYADEALFRASIHPASRTNRISRARVRDLEAITRELLTEAIEYRGSSISDYVDTDGQRGSFQDRHQVYGRDGQPCVRCGSPIVKSVVGQRGTHSCPRCQRR